MRDQALPPPIPRFPSAAAMPFRARLNKLFRRLETSVKRTGPIVLACAAGAAVFFWLGSGFQVVLHGRGVDTLGGQGQTCYPNDSCNRGLTCFQLREQKVCEREVKPVVTVGQKACFEYSSKEGEPHAPCYSSNDECLRSFGRVMQTDATILKGCGFE